MSKMLAEILRIVAEDISGRITQNDVIYEAITNAIHANATEIKCKLLSHSLPPEENGIPVGRKRLDEISVWDNGDGFDTENYESFCNYRTKKKQTLGCKGVGRFTFLKVYKNVVYTSQIEKEQKEKIFSFDIDFDTDNIKEKPIEVQSNSTEVKFSGLNSEYVDTDKVIDRRIYLDLEEIRERVLLHLIPTLFFYKKKGINITIEFIDLATSETSKITADDIPEFDEKKISIRRNDNIVSDFRLYYKIDNTPGRLYGFHCANSRTVCEFSEQDLKLTLPEGYSGFLLLEGDYLDTHVNNERNDFSIYPIKKNIYSPISWEMINTHLKEAVTDLVIKKIPESAEINREKLKSIEEERPYLISYIEEEDINIAGFLDKKSIIDKAKKRFDIEKEKVLLNAGKDSYTDAELAEAIQLTQNELVSYINDRVLVLDRLQKLVDKQERVEAIVHDLFMERGAEDDYFSIGKNNLWLLDDRFTSYSYAASNKRIKHVLSSIGEADDGIDNLSDAPDLSLFFSHNPNNPERLKSVLVEIKPFDYQSKPSRRKFAGIQQLIDYVLAFKTREKIEEIYAFLITDIDDDLAKRLKTDSYVPMFSTESPIYHRFYPADNISIWVVSAKTLIRDATARNRVFLDIIKKQSRLHKIMEKKEVENAS